VEDLRSFTSHKFKALDKFCWRSLETSEYYFSAPEQLNDPADCQIDLEKAFRIARAGLLSTHRPRAEEVFLTYARQLQIAAKTCGIFSMCSGTIDGDGERLLWAHYAGNHTGICLTFEIPRSFVMERLLGFAPVLYGQDDLISALRNLDLARRPEFEADLKPVVTSLLRTKAAEWRYENESRLISYEPGLQAFDRAWLKQICFGLRTSTEDRARVRELSSLYPNCRLAEACWADEQLFRLTLRDA
jgi:hypothetical protein